MPPAVTLAKAAGIAWDNANTHWVLGNLQLTLNNFWSFANGSFPGDVPNNQPVSNWLAVIGVIADQMPSSPTLGDLAEAARAVYGVCWMGSQLFDQSLISSSQAADLLAAYNATFGIP